MDIKIDINENYVLPGLIDCHTHLGIIEEATGKIGVDNNEISDPVTPHAEEFKIKKLVIEHGTEADLVAEYLVERNIPVAFGPMLTPRTKMELKNRNYSSVLKLTNAGVKVSLNPSGFFF